MIKNHRGPHYDFLLKQSLHFESGKAYDIIIEYGQSCELLCYLLGGALSPSAYAEQKILLNEEEVSASKLFELSWEIEPYKTKY